MAKGNTAVEEPKDKQVVTQESTGNLPKELVQHSAVDDMFQEDAGGGLTGLGANDFAIPFLAILQKASPQVSRNNAKYVKGAEEGMVMNTVTGKLFPGQPDGDAPGGILFIPCGYQKQLVRWKSRDSGGGLVCHYEESDPALRQFKRDERGRLFDEVTKDVVIDTAYHFGLLLHDGGFPEMSVISMASTQLRQSRTWNTIMRSIMMKTKDGKIFNPPSFSHVYRLTTIGQTKDKYDWYGWKIVSEGQVQDQALYLLARDFSKQIAEGKVKVSAPPSDFDDQDADAGGSGTKEEIPF
jgi:hypothetical protein